ncbi:Hypothetical protein UVM_LOCUS251 [uncultured virus]|nr:Hypothetical protein UVM_LOCUS251 [uncultured virus]
MQVNGNWDVPGSALHFYKWQGDVLLNTALRTHHITPRSWQLVQEIVQQINKAPKLPDDVIMWRGVQDTPLLRFSELELGDTLTDPGFTSMSTQRKKAQEFRGHSACCLLKIVVPRGTRVAYTKNEHEAITYPGVPFYVVDVPTKAKDYFTVELNPHSVYRLLDDGTLEVPYASEMLGDVYRQLYDALMDDYEVGFFNPLDGKLVRKLTRHSKNPDGMTLQYDIELQLARGNWGEVLDRADKKRKAKSKSPAKKKKKAKKAKK